jgi:hypothetical protein
MTVPACQQCSSPMTVPACSTAQQPDDDASTFSLPDDGIDVRSPSQPLRANKPGKTRQDSTKKCSYLLAHSSKAQHAPPSGCWAREHPPIALRKALGHFST